MELLSIYTVLALSSLGKMTVTVNFEGEKVPETVKNSKEAAGFSCRAWFWKVSLVCGQKQDKFTCYNFRTH